MFKNLQVDAWTDRFALIEPAEEPFVLESRVENQHLSGLEPQCTPTLLLVEVVYFHGTYLQLRIQTEFLEVPVEACVVVTYHDAVHCVENQNVLQFIGAAVTGNESGVIVDLDH